MRNISYKRIFAECDGYGLHPIQRYIALLILVVGCNSEISDRSDGNLSETEEVPIDVKDESNTTGSIRAGYGISSCYIGMPVIDLSNGWEHVPEPELADDMQFNKQSGMYVLQEDGKVTSIDFQYLDRDVNPYQGSTDKGVSAVSSLDEVRAKYGEPSYILESIRSDIGSFPNGNEITVDYIEKGIQFQFINDRLVCISVRAPNKHFDYNGFRKAMGRDIVFMRNGSTGAE